MLKKKLILRFTVLCFGLTFSSLATAALFGPKTYDECILDNMGKATTELAAKAIKESCERKFQDSAPILVSGNTYILRYSGEPVKAAGAQISLLSYETKKDGQKLWSEMKKN